MKLYFLDFLLSFFHLLSFFRLATNKILPLTIVLFLFCFDSVFLLDLTWLFSWRSFQPLASTRFQFLISLLILIASQKSPITSISFFKSLEDPLDLFFVDFPIVGTKGSKEGADLLHCKDVSILDQEPMKVWRTKPPFIFDV